MVDQSIRIFSTFCVCSEVSGQKRRWIYKCSQKFGSRFGNMSWATCGIPQLFWSM